MFLLLDMILEDEILAWTALFAFFGHDIFQFVNRLGLPISF